MSQQLAQLGRLQEHGWGKSGPFLWQVEQKLEMGASSEKNVPDKRLPRAGMPAEELSGGKRWGKSCSSCRWSKSYDG